MLIGFLFRGGLEQWSYAIAADVVAQGVTFVRFESTDVDFATRTIRGEFWEDGQWVKRQTRFPDAIRNFELRDFDKDHILEVVPYSLGRHIRKDEQLELLRRTTGVSHLIPETLTVDDQCDILAHVCRWGGGILKPSRGRLGKGIVFIRANGPGFDLEENGSLHTLTREAITSYLQKFHHSQTRDYILQQFAAGEGFNGRYFSVRIIIQKSSDGDWHPCNVPLSLLAREGTIIANRDEGAVNVDLRALLAWRHGVQAKQVLERLFDAAVKIARTLDDAVDGAADELALDMAVDNNGAPWLHEANWRGGFWLLDDDVGLYRFGGANLVRIAARHRAGCDLDRSAATKIAALARPSAHSLPQGAHDFDAQVTVGLSVFRHTDDTAALTAEAICTGIPVLCVSTASSFRAAQRAMGKAMGAVTDQLPSIPLPWVISRGGICVHDPKDERSIRNWLTEELLAPGLVDDLDLTSGSSLSPPFLRRTIQENRRDLGLETLDTFVIDGVEDTLRHRPDWQERWREVAKEMSTAIRQGEIREWGFTLNDSRLFADEDGHVNSLLAITQDSDIIPPRVLVIESSGQEEATAALMASVHQLARHKLRLLFSLPALPTSIKRWDELHRCLPKGLLTLFAAAAPKGSVILCPVASRNDLLELRRLAEAIPEITSGLSKKAVDSLLAAGAESPDATGGGAPLSDNYQAQRAHNRQGALARFARFDHRQLFRFFVDGRFQQSYRGWSGYEANEPGSATGIMNAYCLVFDNFDLYQGLTSRYIQNLHRTCMANVITKNKKSTPGELRYLESGFNLYKINSTLASLEELLEMRRGDGSHLFHTAGYRKSADEFTAQGLLDALREHGRLRFRNWYPVLTAEQQAALDEGQTLDEFYQVKHCIQRGFALRVDRIVERYNQEIEAAATPFQALTAISRVVRDIELLHPYPDGNGRTLIAVLMTHLLLHEGFLPAILRDPNIDAELSSTEFAEEIQQGIANTELLLADPEATLFAYAISESTPEEIKAFAEMSHQVSLRICKCAQAYAAVEYTDESREEHIYLTLTPDRLARATGGSWLSADLKRPAHLRFLHVGTESNNTARQLLFCRAPTDWWAAGKNPAVEIAKLAATGVTALVTDDFSLAQLSPIPALFVPDVDDALYDAATTARRTVNCKGVAVLGTAGKSTCKVWLRQILRPQATTHATFDSKNLTPQIMTSLANLRPCDQVVITEIWPGTRVNVARHRAKAVAPNLCLYPCVDNISGTREESFSALLDVLAACVDGLQPNGLCLINSTCPQATPLIERIRQRRDVAIQTFGVSPSDHGYLRQATWDGQTQAWRIEAVIFHQVAEYTLPAADQYAPLLSVGVLLTVGNLGYDLEQAAKEFVHLSRG
jgi:UDP-N-acetylmuramoyl-tripeptide--D-alanyl-D-alanine ligase